MKLIILAISLSCAAPAFADILGNVTLIIENDAGMVTQVQNMTQRECDSAAVLLKPDAGSLHTYSNMMQIIPPCLGDGCIFYAPHTSEKPLDSDLKLAKCVTPTNGSK